MPTHLANLSFDFDAMSALIARGMKTPTAISRGEYGAMAVPRILKLLARYNIKASFFMALPHPTFADPSAIAQRAIALPLLAAGSGTGSAARARCPADASCASWQRAKRPHGGFFCAALITVLASSTSAFFGENRPRVRVGAAGTACF